MTDDSIIRILVDRLNRERRETHQSVLNLVEELTDAELGWRPGTHAPAIAFHVWHLARWADHDAQEIDGGEQIWETQSLAGAWGLPDALGESATGTGMDDDVSTNLSLPGKGPIIEYARAAFASLDEAMNHLSRAFVVKDPGAAVAMEKAVDYLFEYPTHDNRHLGMIEALWGQLRERGSATR